MIYWLQYYFVYERIALLHQHENAPCALVNTYLTRTAYSNVCVYSRANKNLGDRTVLSNVMQ
jgi:hypothetical protein